MRLCSEGACLEILPYFGTLDEIYKFMRSYNLKTSQNASKMIKNFASNKRVQRKMLAKGIQPDTKYSLLDNEQRLALDLFKIPAVHLYSK